MADNMKKYLTGLVIRKIKIKTMRSFLSMSIAKAVESDDIPC